MQKKPNNIEYASSQKQEYVSLFSPFHCGLSLCLSRKSKITFSEMREEASAAVVVVIAKAGFTA